MTTTTNRPPYSIMEKIKTDLELNQQNFEKYMQVLRLASVGHMLDDVAHTLNNILGGILGYSQLLKEELQESSDAHRQAATIEKAARRASKLISQLQIFSSKHSYHKKLVDPKSLIEQVVEIVENSIKKNIRLNVELDHGSCKILADIPSISLTLINICLNSREAMPDGGTITIKTRLSKDFQYPVKAKSTLKNPKFICFQVSDTGQGISAEELPHIFEPFFSTKKTLAASGMGLAIAREIVEDHKGKIEVQSEVGKGTVMHIFLPVVSFKKTGQKKVEKISSKVRDGEGEVILVVDDEEDLRDMAKRIFERKGFKVLLAGNGQSAIKVFEENPDKIQLIILDMILPGMDGTQVYKKLKAMHAKSKIILTSGYIHDSSFEKIIDNEVDFFLPKPWDLPELLTKARQAINAT